MIEKISQKRYQQYKICNSVIINIYTYITQIAMSQLSLNDYRKEIENVCHG